MIQPYNLPPLRPDLFGGLRKASTGNAPVNRPSGPPGGSPSGPSGNQPPMDMNKYLIDKVIEIKRRMGGGGSVGALGAISDAMAQQAQPQGGPPSPAQPMRA